MLLSSNRHYFDLDTSAPWAKAASAHLQVGRVSAVPKPMSSFFVCNKEKLLYAPIAKCGCTSIKHLMIELSELEHESLILEHGVHRMTDAFITGAQLKDYDSKRVESILNAEDYFKFAVVRDPVRRIVSAYTEKFFVNRLSTSNILHTIIPIQHIRCQSQPDLQSGVTFREFVHYLVQSQPDRIDSHWAPQHLYLRGVPRYDTIFTMEQMGALAARLSALTGKDIQLGKRNASITQQASRSAANGRYADTLPCELDDLDDISAEDFMAPDLVAMLQSYYHEDLALYACAKDGLEGYEPPPVAIADLSTAALEIPLQSAPEIARFVSIYSKGFFSFDDQGRAQLPVIINNTGEYRLDFDALPSCLLMYEINDCNGETIQAQTAQPVQLGIVEAGGIARVSLALKIPPSSVDQVKSATISLRFGEAFIVEHISPLHLAVATRAIPPSE